MTAARRPVGWGATLGSVVLLLVAASAEGGENEAVPEEAEVIDLTSSTCLPGLIDIHAHPLIATDADVHYAHLDVKQAIDEGLFGSKCSPRAP